MWFRLRRITDPEPATTALVKADTPFKQTIIEAQVGEMTARRIVLTSESTPEAVLPFLTDAERVQLQAEADEMGMSLHALLRRRLGLGPMP